MRRTLRHREPDWRRHDPCGQTRLYACDLFRKRIARKWRATCQGQAVGQLAEIAETLAICAFRLGTQKPRSNGVLNRSATFTRRERTRSVLSNESARSGGEHQFIAQLDSQTTGDPATQNSFGRAVICR